MNDPEYNIKKAAEKDFNDQRTFDSAHDRKAGFIKGVKSPEAKELHTKCLFTGEEVVEILQNYMHHISNYYTSYSVQRKDTPQEFFKRYEKKP